MEFCESRSDNPIRLLSSRLRGKQEFLVIQSSKDLKKVIGINDPFLR